MRILAIDPGTKCGMAWTDNRLVEPHNVRCFDFKPADGEHAGKRFRKLYIELQSLAPEIIFYEEAYNNRNAASAMIQSGFLATILLYGHDHYIQCLAVHWNTIKAHAVKGGCSKEAMIEAAQTDLLYMGTNDNEADALWLLDYALTVAMRD